MGILSESRKESIFIEIACMGLGIISTVFNEKDSDLGLIEKLEILKIKYISVDKEGLNRIIRLKKSNGLNELEFVVSLDNLNETEAKLAAESGLKLVNYNEVKKFDKQFSSKLLDIKATALIVFTSGTTNEPKPVRISHESLMESLTGIVNSSYKFTQEDVLLSNASLAIYSEKILIYLATIFGSRIALCKNFLDEVKIVHPTILYMTPRYLDYLFQQVQQDLSFESSMSQKMFQSAYSKKLKSFNKNKELKKNFWDTVAFNIIKEKFGGRLKLIFIGSGLVNTETAKFFKITLGCDIIETYGSVETGGFTLCSGRDLIFGHVGGPLSSCEIKLSYLQDTTIEGIESTKYGELCIRHTTVPLGYLHENIVDSEGWLHTGDIFKINEETFNFVFLERIDFVMKSKNGWAILPQRLEHLYRQSEFVAQILVYSDYRINGLIAIVVPNQAFVMAKWAGRASDFKALCKGPELFKYIGKNLRELANSKGLKTYEFVREVIIEPTPWTSNDFITSNLKIRRNKVIKRYENQIQEIVQKIMTTS